MKAIKSIRELGRLAADADGKKLGVSQKDGAQILRDAVFILAAFELSTKHEGALKTLNSAVVRRVKQLQKMKQDK